MPKVIFLNKIIKMAIKSSLNGGKQCYSDEAFQVQSKRVCLPKIQVVVFVGGSESYAFAEILCAALTG